MTYMLLKNYVVYLQKLWWNQHQNISINISIRRYVSIRRSNNMCYTLKPDEQNLRIKYSDSDQDHNQVISTQKRQHKGKNTLITISREDSEVSTLLSIQDRFITNGFIPRQRSSQKEKNVMSIEMDLWTTTYLFLGYLNKSMRKELEKFFHTHIRIS